jgi:CheY-like chemotaxis protein
MHFAENGVLMLDLLKKHYEQNELPCLIVLDLNMPKMNGTETLSHIKKDERFKDIPVIIYSTSINPFEKEKCMRLGAHSYITKPITFEDGVSTAKTFHAFCKESSVS